MRERARRRRIDVEQPAQKTCPVRVSPHVDRTAQGGEGPPLPRFGLRAHAVRIVRAEAVARPLAETVAGSLVKSVAGGCGHPSRIPTLVGARSSSVVAALRRRLQPVHFDDSKTPSSSLSTSPAIACAVSVPIVWRAARISCRLRSWEKSWTSESGAPPNRRPRMAPSSARMPSRSRRPGAGRPRLGVLLAVPLEHRGHDVVAERDLIDAVPDVPQHEQIAVVDDRPAVDQRAGGTELEELHHPPVGERHPLGADLEAERLVAGQELLGKLQLPGEPPLQRANLGQRDQRPHRWLRFCRQRLDLAAQAPLDQAVEMKAVQVLGRGPHQEAIEHRPQRVVVGDLVGGAEQRRERNLDAGGAGEEAALVQDAEQRVQDGGVRLEDLVEEDDVRVGEHRLDAPQVGPFPKRLDVDRAEDLVRLGKARQQVLEVAGVDETGQVPDQRRLGGAGRPDDQHVLARHQRDQQQANQLRLVEVARVERPPDLAQLVPDAQRLGVERRRRRGHRREGLTDRRRHGLSS